MGGRGRSQSLTPSGPQRCFPWPFGPDAEDRQKQRAIGARLAWEELREVLRSIYHISGTGFGPKELGGVPWGVQKTP